MELLRNILPILILVTLLLLLPAVYFGPILDLCLVCGMVAVTLIISGILVFFG